MINCCPDAYSLLCGCTLIYYHWEAMLISYLATRVVVLPFKSLEGRHWIKDMSKNVSYRINRHRARDLHVLQDRRQSRVVFCGLVQILPRPRLEGGAMSGIQ